METICKKTITFSIILLLIGVSVSSAISIDTESPIVNQQSVEDCNCKEVDSRHLVVLERQLNRLEVYSRLLLVLSKYNPKLKEISDESSNRILKLTEMFEELTDDSSPIICFILEIIEGSLEVIYSFFINWLRSCEPGTLEWKIAAICCSIVVVSIYPLLMTIFIIGFMYQCWEWPEPPWES